MTTKRVKLQPGELAGIQFMGEVIGTDTNSWRRPADATALTICPSKFNPMKSALFTDPAAARLRFICDYLRSHGLDRPDLNPINVTSFIEFYSAHLKDDNDFKRVCSNRM